MTPNKELREKLSQAWYNCKYDEVGIEQHKKMDEFLEDNKDFILALIPQPEVMSEEEISKKIEFMLSNYVVYGSPVNERTRLSEEIAHILVNKISVEKYCECENYKKPYRNKKDEILRCIYCHLPIKQPAKVEGCNDCGHFQLYKMITSGQPYTYSGEVPCYTCKHYQIMQDRHT